jgi:hypothetical protein
MAALFVCAAPNTHGSFGLVFAAVLFTVLALFGALWTPPGIGKPVLILTHGGVEPAGYAKLP